MIRRTLIAFVAVMLLSVDGWACSSPDYDLQPLSCHENGDACTGSCCDPRARCLAVAGCEIGICAVADGGLQ